MKTAHRKESCSCFSSTHNSGSELERNIAGWGIYICYLLEFSLWFPPVCVDRTYPLTAKYIHDDNVELRTTARGMPKIHTNVLGMKR